LCGFKMLFVVIFRDMSRKDYYVTISRSRSQYYCVSHLGSRRSDCGQTMQVSFVEDKPNTRAVPKGDTPEVVSRHLSIIRIYDRKIKSHPLSSTRGSPGRRAWPKTREGPLTFFIIYSTQQAKTTHARVGKYTCERATASSEKKRTIFVHVTGPHKINQDAASPQRVPWYNIGVQPVRGRSLRQDKTRWKGKQDIQHIHLVKTRHEYMHSVSVSSTLSSFLQGSQYTTCIHVTGPHNGIWQKHGGLKLDFFHK